MSNHKHKAAKIPVEEGDAEVLDELEAAQANEAEEASEAPEGVSAEVAEEVPEEADDGAAQLTQLQADLEAAKQESEEWRAKAYRVSADLDNMRKRFLKEKEDTKRYAIESLLKDLLPVADNLQRVVDNIDNPETPLAKGVTMVLRQFSNELAKCGATSFDPKGEPFDPKLHEAMTQVETGEVPAGHIFQVFQRGWMLHDRLVRPAMVIVATAPAAQKEEAVKTEESETHLEGSATAAEGDDTTHPDIANE